jgi:G3E family GTPase
MRHVPVTILSGFLGSGKTTLLNRILQANQGVRYALIINEFGAIGLDAGLLKGAPQDFVKMDNGCLCCALNEELVKTLEKLAAREDYDAVILETTGVADPLPIAWTFLREPYAASFRFAAIVTVVDALNLETMLTQAQETRLQIERADFVYLSKSDVAAPKQVAQTRAQIAAINAHARIVAAEDPDWAALLFDHDKPSAVALPTAHPSAHQHAATFDSVAVPLQDVAYSLEAVEDFFETLPPEVFRAKAALRVVGRAHPVVIHAVCGRVDFYEEPLYQGALAAVFIGRDLSKSDLAKNFQAALGA